MKKTTAVKPSVNMSNGANVSGRHVKPLVCERRQPKLCFWMIPSWPVRSPSRSLGDNRSTAATIYQSLKLEPMPAVFGCRRGLTAVPHGRTISICVCAVYNFPCMWEEDTEDTTQNSPQKGPRLEDWTHDLLTGRAQSAHWPSSACYSE